MDSRGMSPITLRRPAAASGSTRLRALMYRSEENRRAAMHRSRWSPSLTMRKSPSKPSSNTQLLLLRCGSSRAGSHQKQPRLRDRSLGLKAVVWRSKKAKDDWPRRDTRQQPDQDHCLPRSISLHLPNTRSPSSRASPPPSRNHVSRMHLAWRWATACSLMGGKDSMGLISVILCR